MTISANVRKLVDEYDQGNQSAAGRRCHLQQRVIGRIYNGEGCNIETLESIAQGYGFKPWQLLVEGFDPINPPKLYEMTAAEEALYAKLRDAAKELATLKPHT